MEIDKNLDGRQFYDAFVEVAMRLGLERQISINSADLLELYSLFLSQEVINTQLTLAVTQLAKGDSQAALTELSSLKRTRELFVEARTDFFRDLIVRNQREADNG